MDIDFVTGAAKETLPSLVVFFFFFSSRRRHTRSTRDWSSDVCSSDLRQPHVCVSRCAVQPPDRKTGSSPCSPRRQFRAALAGLFAPPLGRATGGCRRSEERRVGKEGRARGWREQEDRRGRVECGGSEE